MEPLLTTSNIMFVIGIAGVVFTVFNYFNTPLVKSDKNDALLSQQMQYFITGTEQRFAEQQKNFNSLLLQSNNHIHTVDTKVESLSEKIGTMGLEISRLATVIEERVPRKNS